MSTSYDSGDDSGEETSDYDYESDRDDVDRDDVEEAAARETEEKVAARGAVAATQVIHRHHATTTDTDSNTTTQESETETKPEPPADPVATSAGHAVTLTSSPVCHQKKAIDARCAKLERRLAREAHRSSRLAYFQDLAENDLFVHGPRERYQRWQRLQTLRMQWKEANDAWERERLSEEDDDAGVWLSGGTCGGTSSSAAAEEEASVDVEHQRESQRQIQQMHRLQQRLQWEQNEGVRRVEQEQ